MSPLDVVTKALDETTPTESRNAPVHRLVGPKHQVEMVTAPCRFGQRTLPFQYQYSLLL